MLSTGMQARVLRIGQLSGDRASAQWNDTEAVALMFRSALTTGALPELDERISWLPVDQCAEAIADIAMNEMQSGDPDLVYHLANPAAFHWKHDLLPVLQQRSTLPAFEVVSPQEWLQRLENSEPDPQKNPSVKLIGFWRSKYARPATTEAQTTAKVDTQSDDEVTGLVFETEHTVRDCPSLGAIQDPVSEGLMERYVDAWMKKWTSA